MRESVCWLRSGRRSETGSGFRPKKNLQTSRICDRINTDVRGQIRHGNIRNQTDIAGDVRWVRLRIVRETMEEFLSDNDLDALLAEDPEALAGELEIEGMDEAMEMSASNRRYEEIIKKHADDK